MTTVAFDTSTASTVAAVEVGSGVFEKVLDAPPAGHPAHSAQLLASLDSLLLEAGSSWDAVERIGVGEGPGTFTGLRIAAATAEGLRRSTGAVVVGVSSLEALALPALEGGTGLPACAVIDARRGEVFMGGWSAEGEKLFGPVAGSPEQCLELLRRAGEAWQLAGRLPEAFEEPFSSSGLFDSPVGNPAEISGGSLCLLTARGFGVSGAMVPAYVREPDAVRPAA